VICAECGTENAEARKFCDACGAQLAATCASCGAPNRPGARFCGECGSSLAEGAAARAAGPPPPAAAPAPAHVTERRLVSVLFADLVGFTALSESRDSEDVRALQSRYFDVCRRLIELYGGTVEKFIGDAVMAVWGAQSATEDDAERAVRAALDLAAAVSALGDETGVDDLRARVGVLTGEATVAIGAPGEGLVTGDVVNAASRIQGLAGAGHVLVGDPTRRATEPTIVYEDAGEHELKGRVGLHRLWRATRVVSGARGSLRSEGLEAPFVGRDRELRQIKELFHTCAEERRAHLVSVTGIAGIGKSRLVWEFYKYFDGLAQVIYWHRGRCLSYGEGVTYWALADMVRMRCRIAEDEAPSSALAKLAMVLDEHIADEEERRFVEPRVAHLLGLEQDAAFTREELFAAWRVFFERLADVNPVVLAFEDMQWADSSLLDFIEHLLDWARGSPILVVTAARPELVERRPTWGAGKRNFSSTYLEPLSAQAMGELLDGLVVGLSDRLREQILARAEGVPLYAVETVRMLIDQGHLVRDGSAYRPAGPVQSLQVPETLHALIAARLDSLAGDERRLVQDASVLGKTFTRQALEALSQGAGVDVAAALAGLVRKEILTVQSDPRSPEHGQYGFLQDLVRHVAYEQLPRRERRARHLAAAAHLTTAAPDEDEVVEVIAAHYLAAHQALPDAGDAAEIGDRARAMLVRAGERAASLAAATQAARYLTQAAELTGDDAERAVLLDRAGEMAARAGDTDTARGLYERSIELHEGLGDTHAAARVLSRLGRMDAFTDRRDEALERMERAFAVISGDPPDEDLALLAASLALGHWYSGDLERAARRAELALDVAEAIAHPLALVRALRAKAYLASSNNHAEETLALLAHTLKLALEHDLLEEAGTTDFLLSDRCFARDEYAAALSYLDEALALVRKNGDRVREWATLSERTYPQTMLGRWDEVEAAAAEFSSEQVDSGAVVLSMLQSTVAVRVNRGERDRAAQMLALFARMETISDLQARGCFLAARAWLHRSEGRLEEALADAEGAIETRHTLGLSAQAVKQAIVEGVEAAFALGDAARRERLLGLIESVPPGSRTPYLDAQLRRFRARATGDPTGLAAAARGFRDLSIPFWLAVTLCEQSELLMASGEPAQAEPLLAEAHEIFAALGARPWLERVAAAGGSAVSAAAGPSGG
jgi:class 3 adenylate cyclase/tetratricopeptide (TPR) repeat protein